MGEGWFGSWISLLKTSKRINWDIKLLLSAIFYKKKQWCKFSSLNAVTKNKFFKSFINITSKSLMWLSIWIINPIDIGFVTNLLFFVQK